MNIANLGINTEKKVNLQKVFLREINDKSNRF